MGLGVLTPVMFVIGLMFLGLYLITYVLGRRLENGHQDRAAELPPAKR